MTPSNSDEIEKLVRDAAQDESPKAQQRLFSALRCTELFFPRTVVQHEGRQVNATPLLRLPDGKNAMMLYTSRDHPDLPDTFGGGSFQDALAAAQEMPDLDWVILSNRASQWIAISRERIPAVLDNLRPDESRQQRCQDPRPSAADEILENQITLAVTTPPAQLSPPIGSLLRGREVFIELAEGRNADGRPVMNTFQVEGLQSVIRAYTNRTRPEISYGGIQWEALKDMIRNASELDGVQVVNQADDWVVFDRDSLGRETSDLS